MPRIIKRYSNRKLYDTEDKRYITLEQIQQLVQDGQDIKVVENQTGEDLTTVTLSQILLEQEKRKEGKLPKSFFMDLVQRSSTTVVDFMRKNVLQYFDSSMLSEEQLSENVDQLVKAGEIPQDEATQLKAEIKTRTQSFKQRLDELVERRVQDVLTKLNIPTKAEIERLNQRLDALSRRLGEPEADADEAPSPPRAGAVEGRP
ncbi:MAG: phasin family protein [Planctomycetes bacterium]|nr:phasin family protein [Planctomycetota bacterium]